eukprot:TRINITY_DN560_c0_g5_i1.p1 TRINITY_DN560_c0_g5~~TRINITY_DN560_c0_g5_i1.p1  ORF type:complete len:335 (+),score=57.53 TRINITY_DN560_c0_g5_i1:64-1068(+)
MATSQRRKEIFTYSAEFPIHGLDFSERGANNYRVCMSSFIEEYVNKVRVVHFNEETAEFKTIHEIAHPYPVTKVKFLPDSTGTKPDYLVTSADYLRLWHLEEGGVAKRLIRFDNDKGSEFCAPITSFDWSYMNTSNVVVSSIDTTCTFWDIQAEKAVAQLIAHDKEVYDVSFHPRSPNEFASVGEDGSIRLFDIRSLDHSTIMYETPNFVPILRMSWNNNDPNFIASVVMDSTKIVVIDIRMPSAPVVELDGHGRCVNSITWAPHSACHMATGADDGYIFIWDLSSIPETTSGPLLAYSPGSVPGAEINQICWSRSQPKWITCSYGPNCQLLRV